MAADKALYPSRSLDPRLREAVRVLESETPGPTNAELAARLGWTEVWFVRLFSRVLGIPPHRYAAELRLRGAAGRLRYTDDPIEQIARDFAWASQPTFTRAFSDRYGEPPARFRRRVRAEALGSSGKVDVPERDVRLEWFAPQPLFALRYPGARRGADAQWADFLSRVPPHLLAAARIGLVFDDPRIHAPGTIHYDCAVCVRASATLPPELAEQGFERLVAPGGEWACADAVGAAGAAAAYRRILADWLPTRPDRTLEGDPHLERFLVTPEGAASPRLTVCLRVRDPAEPPRPGMSRG